MEENYQKYIDEIKSMSEFIGCDYAGRETYRIPVYQYYTLVKLLKDVDGEYANKCMFQRWSAGSIEPTLWTMLEPERFIDLFRNEFINSKLPQGYMMTPRELSKSRYKRFYNKNNIVCWQDDKGYIYMASKSDMPDKYKSEEYEKFKDNKEALLVSVFGDKTAWFNNEKELKDYLAEKKNPIYDIKKIGYTKKPPQDRKVVYRLPYLDLDMEIAEGNSDYKISSRLCKLCQDSNEISSVLLKNIVKTYRIWKEKEREKNNESEN